MLKSYVNLAYTYLYIDVTFQYLQKYKKNENDYF